MGLGFVGLRLGRLGFRFFFGNPSGRLSSQGLGLRVSGRGSGLGFGCLGFGLQQGWS